MTLMKTTVSKTSLTQSLATVTGVLTTAVASSQASVVLNQITLTGNRISNDYAITLNADVTGDGINDISINSASVINDGSTVGVSFELNGGVVKAIVTSSSSFHAIAKFVPLNENGVGVYKADGQQSVKNVRYLNPISFTDARINGGASTQGYLEVNAFNTSFSSHTVALTRLVFNPNSATMTTAGLSTGTTYTEWVAPAVVPEPSSLGLLALGAGGLLARRRRQAA